MNSHNRGQTVCTFHGFTHVGIYCLQYPRTLTNSDTLPACSMNFHRDKLFAFSMNSQKQGYTVAFSMNSHKRGYTVCIFHEISQTWDIRSALSINSHKQRQTNCLHFPLILTNRDRQTICTFHKFSQTGTGCLHFPSILTNRDIRSALSMEFTQAGIY